MSQVEQLYKLQQIDTEMQTKKQRLREVLSAQKASAAVQAAQKRAETAAALLKKWQATHKELNLELSSLNSKAKNSENRLYSGKVKSPKELADLQHEIESLARRRAALEDEILEAMLEMEEAEAEQTAADETLAKAEAAWEQDTAVLKEEQNELALRLHKLTGMRQELLATVTPPSLAEYEHLRQRKGGVAVVNLRVNQCMGCQLTVSASKVKDAREGKLVHCGGCDRILHPVG